ncbi:MAG TPA: hypothetical protein VF282_11030 [Bacillota bacterium]
MDGWIDQPGRDPEEAVPAEIEFETGTDSPVRVNGREVGDVIKGLNGRWFFVGLSGRAEAYPLRWLDNVANSGAPDQLTAIRHALHFRPR